MKPSRPARHVRGRVLRRLWPLIRWWRGWRLERAAPWPLVWECYGTSKGIPHEVGDGTFTDTCPQCDGSHYHAWVAWHEAPEHGLAIGGPGVPVRCRICGARKCDRDDCTARRHHRDPHTDGAGYFEPIGRLP